MSQNLERKALLLRGPEVAEALGISRALAYRWMQQGVLPTVRVSRSVRVPHDGLLRWIERNTSNLQAAPMNTTDETAGLGKLPGAEPQAPELRPRLALHRHADGSLLTK